MNIDAIKNGIVIDHIPAGRGMRLYELLGLDELDCPVAVIKNASSPRMGRKDIIKIDADIAVDLDIIGYVAPNVTINIIRDCKRCEKRTIDLPQLLTGVIHCKNPRCITSTEPALPQRFKLTDRENRVYRCVYCETRSDETYDTRPQG